MKLFFSTQLSTPFEVVQANFDQKLFEFLLPPKFAMKLEQFDGQHVGATVRMKILFPSVSTWEVQIVEDHNEEGFYWFLDEGTKLPWGLKNWKHRHAIKKTAQGTEIVDDISFDVDKIWKKPILYFILFFGFFPRKFQYKKYFKKFDT